MESGYIGPLEDLLDEETFWSSEHTMQSYAPAGSFVRYLIDTAGIEKFKRLYSAVEWPTPASTVKSTFEGIYGVSFDEVASDWKVFVQTY